MLSDYEDDSMTAVCQTVKVISMLNELAEKSRNGNFYPLSAITVGNYEKVQNLNPIVYDDRDGNGTIILDYAFDANPYPGERPDIISTYQRHVLTFAPGSRVYAAQDGAYQWVEVVLKDDNGNLTTVIVEQGRWYVVYQ